MCEGVGWIELAQDNFQWLAVLNIRNNKPSGFIKAWNLLTSRVTRAAASAKELYSSEAVIP